ncbi:hypothetical protein AJ88_27700 [Mesorhizobium amorphae CCBAU 01583]|nr:hypothetical protein AJ88_27700 [Mesorhizobium amorphae CCBAU 01583]
MEPPSEKARQRAFRLAALLTPEKCLARSGACLWPACHRNQAGSAACLLIAGMGAYLLVR